MVNKHQSIMRLVVLAILLAGGIVCYRVNPEFFRTILELLLKGDIEGSIELIRSYGPYAMLLSFGIVVFINTVAVLPNIFILAANGVIFGVVKGTIISWLAECVGVIISFILMRYFFRDYAQSIIERSNYLQKIDQFSGESGFKIMIIARCIPYIPSGLITALGALSSISFRDYVLATLIGKLPSAWIEVTMGHDLLSYREHSLRLTLLVVISAIAYYLFFNYKKKES